MLAIRKSLLLLEESARKSFKEVNPNIKLKKPSWKIKANKKETKQELIGPAYGYSVLEHPKPKRLSDIENFPYAAIEFLSAASKFGFTIKGKEYGGPEVIVFHAPSTAKHIILNVEPLDEDTAEDYQNFDDPHNGKKGEYQLVAFDLIAKCTDFSPEALFIFIPELDCFGAFDYEHNSLTVFPQVPWTDIQADLPLYLGAQWGVPYNWNTNFIREWNVFACYDIWKVAKWKTST